tara:strand:- start:216 stop:410 length:195 start_codon:yes stop_codon:yes gene_type:complete
LKDKNNKVKDLKIPKVNIKTVIQDPEAYARDFMEIAFATYIRSFKEAFNEGKKLAEELERGKES